MTFVRGFKARADKIAIEVRGKVGLSPIDPLDVDLLCDHMEIDVIRMTSLPCDVSKLCGNDNDCFSSVVNVAPDIPLFCSMLPSRQPRRGPMADDINTLLSDEYLHLQRVIEEFDQRALTLKAWSVSFSAAGLGLAYSEREAAILLIAALSALVFWIVEGSGRRASRPITSASGRSSGISAPQRSAPSPSASTRPGARAGGPGANIGSPGG